MLFLCSFLTTTVLCVYGDVTYDEDVDAIAFCQRAEELFELYQRCANRRQIETICVNYLRSLEATKVTGNGHNYFVPRQSMAKVDVFESFIDALNGLNKNDSFLTANSFYIIDDAKQRDKMTEEFYSAVKKEITDYQERADYLIKSGSANGGSTRSPRWRKRSATMKRSSAVSWTVWTTNLKRSNSCPRSCPSGQEGCAFNERRKMK